MKVKQAQRAVGNNVSRYARATMLAATVLLAACQSSGIDSVTQLDNSGQAPVVTPNANGEVFGNGPVRVALLLPKTAPGNAASVANELRNGALMAQSDNGQAVMQLVVKDTAGQAAGAQAAANEAVLEGSSAIFGPVFAASVSAASAVTQPAGRPIFAFSTDSAVAKRNVYLLNFLPQEDTKRAVTFAISQGKRSIYAFLPTSAEGALRESVLRQTAGSSGAAIFVARYERSVASIDTAVAEASRQIEQIDAIYIPEGGDVPLLILQAFQRAGAKTFGKQLIGSGLWETVKTGDPLLEGAVYPVRDVSAFENFAARYQTLHGARPGIWAALGYDSITFAINQIKQYGPQRAFNSDVVENPRGFAGISGLFRLRSDGTAERGLGIMQIRDGKPQLVSPAPTSFSRS